jgi:hypothetical protein
VENFFSVFVSDFMITGLKKVLFGGEGGFGEKKSKKKVINDDK